MKILPIKSKSKKHELGYESLFSYGNQDISGEGDFRRAHLDTSLKISPKEQADFLQKFVSGTLSVSTRALQMAKDLLLAQTYSSS